MIVRSTTTGRWLSHLADHRGMTDRFVCAIGKRDHSVALRSAAIKPAGASQFLIEDASEPPRAEVRQWGVIVTSRIRVCDETRAPTEADRNSPRTI